MLLPFIFAVNKIVKWVVDQFARNVSCCVILSDARVRRSRDERKSKDPENVSAAVQLQGILLKTFFHQSRLFTVLWKEK